MERFRLNRNTLILGSIGLVLVGLLAGILFMLVIDEDAAPAGVTPPVVERVQLGALQPMDFTHVPVGESALADMARLNGIFRQVAEHVTPAVVYIQVETAGSELLPRDWFHRDQGDFPERFYRDPGPRQSMGSGVILNPEGYIVTNNHVVEGASTIIATLTDKRQFEAHIVGVDPSTDLAVLRIEDARDLPTIPLGNSDSIRVGDWALAVGNPFRLTSTVTAGIISALGRQVNIIEDDFGIEDFIQTDAAINPGNSGGALVNLQGELIGVSTAIATESGSYEGYGFAVPVNLMQRVVEDLIAYGEVKRGFLGVEIGDVDASDARRFGMEQASGVLLERVWEDGAAARAGLRRGDIVLSIDSLPVNALNELQRLIARHRPGDKLHLNVWRQGQSHQYEVELLGREDPSYAAWFNEQSKDSPLRMPDLEPQPPDVKSFEMAQWGIGVSPIPAHDRKIFGADEGAYITSIKSGSPGALAGLPRDVVISHIEDMPISSASQAVRALNRAAEGTEPVLLGVRRRDGTTAFYELDVPTKD